MTAYDIRISDWSSDVCSSDLVEQPRAQCRLHIGQAAGDRAMIHPNAPGRGQHIALPHHRQEQPQFVRVQHRQIRTTNVSTYMYICKAGPSISTPSTRKERNRKTE